jgi:hypothetical protein
VSAVGLVQNRFDTGDGAKTIPSSNFRPRGDRGLHRESRTKRTLMTANLLSTTTTVVAIPPALSRGAEPLSFLDWLKKDSGGQLLYQTAVSSGYAADAEFLKKVKTYSRFDWSWFFTQRGVPKDVFRDCWRRYTEATRP